MLGYSCASVLYAENSSAAIAKIEMSVGIGLTLSPVLGSLLFEIGGFTFPFYSFGIKIASIKAYTLL
jgi:hypothetical protein